MEILVSLSRNEKDAAHKNHMTPWKRCDCRHGLAGCLWLPLASPVCCLRSIPGDCSGLNELSGKDGNPAPAGVASAVGWRRPQPLPWGNINGVHSGP